MRERDADEGQASRHQIHSFDLVTLNRAHAGNEDNLFTSLCTHVASGVQTMANGRLQRGFIHLGWAEMLYESC